MAEKPEPSAWLPPRAPSRSREAVPTVAEPDRDESSGARGRRPARRSRSSPLATWSLVTGVAGLAALVLTLGIAAVLTLPCSAAAWACATVDRRRSQALDPHRPLPARVGRILGIAGVVLGILALVLWSVLLAGAGSVEEVLEQWRDALEREQRRGATGN